MKFSNDDSPEAIEAYDRILRGAHMLLAMGRWDEETFRKYAGQALLGKATELRLTGNHKEADICAELAREHSTLDMKEGDPGE